MIARTSEEWNALVVKAERVFDLSKEWPDVVNRVPTGSAPFFDDWDCYEPDAWPAFAPLAALFGDAKMHLVTLDPDPNAFLTTLGEYGAFSLPLTATPEEVTACYYRYPLEIAACASLLVLVGDSGRWGVWAQRDGIAMVVSDDDNLVTKWKAGYDMEFGEIEEVLAPDWHGHRFYGPDGPWFVEKMIDTYRPPRSGLP